ncbi:MAG: hypothetical protein J6I54_03535 [Bacteroidaceae bacterium]|nr:hypothetical protein [Bacteroidaceae bacterium]
MRRSLCTLLLVFVAIANVFAQTVETPVCYGYSPELKFTLKYKFSYGEENFYTNLRFIRGSESILMAGDKIIMKTKDGKNITFDVTGDKLSGIADGYIPFETTVEELSSMQKGVTGISFVRDGKSYVIEPIKDKFAYTKQTASTICKYAFISEKLKSKEPLIKAEKETALKVQELKKQKREIGIAPNLYHRIYLGYAPYNYSGNVFSEDLNIGYTAGIRLTKPSLSGSALYLQLGAQVDWEITPTGYKDGISITIPIDLTHRFYIGHSNVAISPFVGAEFRIIPRHYTQDGALLQPGFEVGANLDYKHLNVGVLYHMEIFCKNNLGHNRGIAVRLGVTL